MARARLTDKSLQKPPPEAGQLELWDDLVPGFGLRIAAGGSRTFFVMKRLNGKLVRRTVGKAPPPSATTTGPGELRLADARAKARQMLSDLARGIDPVEREQPGERQLNTFSEVAAAYFADPARRGGAKLASKAELERKVRIDLAAWCDRPIAEITKAEIKALLSAKRETSPVAANRLLSLLKRIFGWAAIEDIIPANPAAYIEGTEEQERDRVLTLDELRRVWHGAEAMGYPYGPLIQLLILTAQRRNEVAELVWAEIDGTAWRLPDSRSKRGKGHLIPLSPRAVSILGDLPKIGDKPTYVFTTGRRAAKKGQKVDREAPPAAVSGWSRMKTRLDSIIAKQAAKAADKPLDLKEHTLPAWTLHDLRRSVATHLRDPESMGEARVDRLTVSKILNHAEGGMTRLYDRYSSDPEKRAALEAWALRVERLCGLNVVNMTGAKSSA
jgi:integrase